MRSLAKSMLLKVLWPGKTHDANLREIQDHYLKRINMMVSCKLVETREARGIPERQSEKIKEIETEGISKHITDDYVICLTDRGREMDSQQFSVFIDRTAMNQPHPVSFVVGGFLGLTSEFMARADSQLSLSRLTFSHELTRVILLEQIYRALTILKGHNYAK